MLKDILSKIAKERGGVANIHKSFEYFPEGMNAHYEFYKAIMLKENLPLNRLEREFLAVETSKHNECEYCIKHHEEALEQISIQKKFDLLDSTTKEIFSELALVLTKTPWKASLMQAKFKNKEISLEKYQHAVMIVSYFNFSNRCAFALDVKLEANFQSTCGGIK